MHITLHGIVSEVLGGYICLRGFAKISDLSNISKVEDYQRDIIPEHIEKLQKFYEKGKYLFFPEIILGCSLPEYKYSGDLRENKMFSYGGVKYRYLKTANQGYLTIDTEIVRLQRIDGNHRISAYKDGITALQEVPFCILFLAEEQRYKDAKAIFNNINYKHKPLHQEDNLRNIFDETSLYTYSDNEIENDFGANYKKVKYLIKELENNDKQYLITDFVDQHYREVCFNIVNILDSVIDIKQNEYLNTENLYNVIVEVLKLQNDKIDIGLFIAFVYYKLLDKINPKEQKYLLFNNWVKRNRISDIKNLCSEDVISIFNNVLTRKKRQIFVSMPFNKPDCDQIFNSILKVVNQISKQYDIDTPLVLRIDELQQSSTYKIINKIENAIEDTGYLIAILNHCNPNVYHEIGYAMGYFRGKGIDSNVLLVLQENNKDSNNSDNGKNINNVGFNLQGYKQLRFLHIADFEKELRQKLLNHYGLK